jgi:hypothetical protein
LGDARKLKEMLNEKLYMVVKLPKNDTDINNFEFAPHHDYDVAFDSFNETVASECQQIFKQGKYQKALRAAFDNYDLELWIINRTNELVK